MQLSILYRGLRPLGRSGPLSRLRRRCAGANSGEEEDASSLPPGHNSRISRLRCEPLGASRGWMIETYPVIPAASAMRPPTRPLYLSDHADHPLCRDLGVPLRPYNNTHTQIPTCTPRLAPI